MTAGAILGFHGVVLRTENPEKDARQWRRRMNLRVLHRSAREIVLGQGPEFFVVLRAARAGQAEQIEEIHVAVKALRQGGAESDRLGGRSVSRKAGAIRLVLRQFIGAPRRAWPEKRREPPDPREKRSRRGGKAPARSTGRGNR